MRQVLARVDATLTDLAGLGEMSLGDGDIVRVLDALTSASSRLTRELCRAAAEADRRRLGDATGARHAHQWWAARSRHTHAEAARLTKLGRALEDDLHAPTARALADGRLRVEQARVIVQAVDAIPASVRLGDGTTRIIDPSARAQARDHLLAGAVEHDSKALRRLGRRILDVVAPELADEQKRNALEAEERQAAKKTYLTGRRLGDGSTDVRGNLPDATWDRLTSYLEAYTSPRQPGQEPDNPDDRRPYELKLGSAFVSFLEHVDPRRLPLHGGDATTVMVTIDHATLTEQVGSSGIATIDDQPLSAAAVRRLACTANIIPVVLGGQSEILDLGRARRLFSRAQRKALRLKHKRCRAKGCRVKAAWTEAHHLRQPWGQGGSTDLDVDWLQAALRDPGGLRHRIVDPDHAHRTARAAGPR